jgi:hypothetical protein
MNVVVQAYNRILLAMNILIIFCLDVWARMPTFLAHHPAGGRSPWRSKGAPGYLGLTDDRCWLARLATGAREA